MSVYRVLESSPLLHGMKRDLTSIICHSLLDPCTHRVPVVHLSKLTGARVLSVRYRLAPQNPFPAALVDALVAYLSLISPAPGSFHEPVPADKIVISGDSAGGNLSLALLQTLLTLRRISPTVRFHGQDVPIALPGGVALTSPWCDLTLCMPSHFTNAAYDYITSPSIPSYVAFHPLAFPPDDIWPSNPPRADMFVSADAVLHPLVSPMTAPTELWKDAPPVFINVGEEALTDEALVLARKMYHAGVRVVVEQFEGMPHCFGMLMIGTPAGRRFFTTFSAFCRDVTTSSASVECTGNLIHVGSDLQSIREIPLDELDLLSDKEIGERLRKSRELRIEAENKLLSEWRERARL